MMAKDLDEVDEVDEVKEDEARVDGMGVCLPGRSIFGFA